MLKGHKYCIYCGFELDLSEEGYCNECGKTNKYIHEYPNLIEELEKMMEENNEIKIYTNDLCNQILELKEALRQSVRIPLCSTCLDINKSKFNKIINIAYPELNPTNLECKNDKSTLELLNEICIIEV